MCQHTDIEINSADRTPSSVSSTNFQVALPHSYSAVSKATLRSVKIPNVFYNISSTLGNATIVWQRGANGYSVTIPDGNYSTTTLATQLAASMNATDSNSYQIAFSTTSYTTTITGTAAFTIYFGSAPAVGMAKILGFNPVSTATATVVTGTKAWNLALPYTFYINISQLGMFAESTSKNQYTFLLPSNANGGDLITFDEGNYKNSISVNVANLSFLNIELRTTNGAYANLLGLDWTFILRLSTNASCGCK